MNKHLENKTPMKDWDEKRIGKAIAEWELPENWKFSPSQLSTYRECSRKWAYSYICNILQPFTWLGTIIGSTFHEFIEYLNKHPKDHENITIDDIKNTMWYLINDNASYGVEVNWSKPYNQENIKVFNEGLWWKELVDKSAERIKYWLDNMPTILINAESEKTVEVEGGDKFIYDIKGYADLVGIDPDTGSETVVDYKTTYSMGRFDKNKYDIQAAVYMVGLGLNKFKFVICLRMPKVKVKIKVVDWEWTDDEVNAKISEINSLMKNVKDKRFEKKAVQDEHCTKLCGYYSLCWGENDEVKQDVIKAVKPDYLNQLGESEPNNAVKAKGVKKADNVDGNKELNDLFDF